MQIIIFISIPRKKKRQKIRIWIRKLRIIYTEENIINEGKFKNVDRNFEKILSDAKDILGEEELNKLLIYKNFT